MHEKSRIKSVNRDQIACSAFFPAFSKGERRKGGTQKKSWSDAA